MSGNARAFGRGALGCLVGFAVVALLTLVVGGSVYADLGGLILLGVIGGVLGLVANAIYQKGRRDGGGRP